MGELTKQVIDCIIYELLNLINESNYSLVIEALGDDEKGTDILATRFDGIKEHQQCKARKKSRISKEYSKKMFELVIESNIDIAAEIHSVSWKESHKGFCSEKFVSAHTKERQRQYIENEIACGKQFYLLVENGAKGIVSIKDNLIENLYVLPNEQGKGYGTKLLKYAEILCTGIPTLWILSNNKAAKNFYQKHGYIFTENKKFLNDELSELEMQHKLDNWFTVEKIDEATYVISEYKHREETHCYLLIGNEKALLIDTGLGVANIKEVVNAITDLPIMVVVTHVHWDHIGGHKYFDNVAVHENEKEWLMGKFPLPLEIVKRNLLDENCEFPESFDVENYEIFHGIPRLIMYDNDEIDLGERVIKVIHASGHSPGHCCFYEEQRQYLYSGDLIYKGCLDMFYPSTSPCQFAQSIKRVNQLNVRKILPGHHDLDVPVQMIFEIDEAFSILDKSGELKQGEGIFEFGDF